MKISFYKIKLRASTLTLNTFTESGALAGFSPKCFVFYGLGFALQSQVTRSSVSDFCLSMPLHDYLSYLFGDLWFTLITICAELSAMYVCVHKKVFNELLLLTSEVCQINAS